MNERKKKNEKTGMPLTTFLLIWKKFPKTYGRNVQSLTIPFSDLHNLTWISLNRTLCSMSSFINKLSKIRIFKSCCFEAERSSWSWLPFSRKPVSKWSFEKSQYNMPTVKSTSIKKKKKQTWFLVLFEFLHFPCFPTGTSSSTGITP